MSAVTGDAPPGAPASEGDSGQAQASAADADANTCALCFSRPRCCVFTACGHCVACEPCAQTVVSRPGASCPVCRAQLPREKAWALVASGLGPVTSYQPELVDPAVREFQAVKRWKQRVGGALLELAEELDPESLPAFVTGGSVTVVGPKLPLALSVSGCAEGVPFALPLSEEALAALRGCAERAPYGKGSATVTDTTVRDAWQLDAGRITLGKPDEPAGRALDTEEWLDDVACAAERAADALGVPSDVHVEARLYKLLLYGPGGHFAPHQDTAKEDGMFATLVIQLPVCGGHRGGALRVQPPAAMARRGAHDVEDAGDFRRLGELEDECMVPYAAFFCDCTHQLEPVTEGTRVALVYNLVIVGGAADAHLAAALNMSLPSTAALTSELNGWPAAAPNRLAFPLTYQYTRAGLGFDALKGRDAALVAQLRTMGASDPAADAESNKPDAPPLLEVALALVTRKVEIEGFSWDSRSRSGSIFTDGWILPHDCAASVCLGKVLLADKDGVHAELVGCDKLEWPDEPEAHARERYTGNQGPSETQWYTCAVVVFWRRSGALSRVFAARGVVAAAELVKARVARHDCDAVDALSQLLQLCSNVSSPLADPDAASAMLGAVRALQGREQLQSTQQMLREVLLAVLHDLRAGLQAAFAKYMAREYRRNFDELERYADLQRGLACAVHAADDSEVDAAFEELLKWTPNFDETDVADACEWRAAAISVASRSADGARTVALDFMAMGDVRRAEVAATIFADIRAKAQQPLVMTLPSGIKLTDLPAGGALTAMVMQAFIDDVAGRASEMADQDTEKGRLSPYSAEYEGSSQDGE